MTIGFQIKKKRRGFYKWCLLTIVFMHAFMYMLYVRMHRHPKDDILLKATKI